MLTGLTPSNSFARNEIYSLKVSVVLAALLFILLAKRAVRLGCLFKKVASSHGHVYYFSV
jgi:hypothetical protein